MAMAIEDMIAEGDMAAVRTKANGTDQGEVLGMAPTGKSFSVEHVH